MSLMIAAENKAIRNYPAIDDLMNELGAERMVMSWQENLCFVSSIQVTQEHTYRIDLVHYALITREGSLILGITFPLPVLVRYGFHEESKTLCIFPIT